jgi:hypothetical protein
MREPLAGTGQKDIANRPFLLISRVSRNIPAKA